MLATPCKGCDTDETRLQYRLDDFSPGFPLRRASVSIDSQMGRAGRMDPHTNGCLVDRRLGSILLGWPEVILDLSGLARDASRWIHPRSKYFSDAATRSVNMAFSHQARVFHAERSIDEIAFAGGWETIDNLFTM